VVVTRLLDREALRLTNPDVIRRVTSRTIMTTVSTASRSIVVAATSRGNAPGRTNADIARVIARLTGAASRATICMSTSHRNAGPRRVAGAVRVRSARRAVADHLVVAAGAAMKNHANHTMRTVVSEN
jgi:hypothetical protein